jgi:hypothetical protein
MAEREGMGRHGGEVRGPRRRRVWLLREEAPDMCGSGCGRGQPGHPASSDPTPVADGGEAEEEWKRGSDGKGRLPEPDKDHEIVGILTRGDFGYSARRPSWFLREAPARPAKEGD